MPPRSAFVLPTTSRRSPPFGTTKAKLLAWWRDYGKAYWRAQIDRFAKDMKNGKVVELRDTTHGGFVFEKEQHTILIREMRKFPIPGP
jgi:hypothetical protein